MPIRKFLRSPCWGGVRITPSLIESQPSILLSHGLIGVATRLCNKCMDLKRHGASLPNSKWWTYVPRSVIPGSLLCTLEPRACRRNNPRCTRFVVGNCSNQTTSRMAFRAHSLLYSTFRAISSVSCEPRADLLIHVFNSYMLSIIAGAAV